MTKDEFISMLNEIKKGSRIWVDKVKNQKR
jgi:hypothetical protein